MSKSTNEVIIDAHSDGSNKIIPQSSISVMNSNSVGRGLNISLH
jgi:hypothetical protein